MNCHHEIFQFHFQEMKEAFEQRAVNFHHSNFSIEVKNTLYDLILKSLSIRQCCKAHFTAFYNRHLHSRSQFHASFICSKCSRMSIELYSSKWWYSICIHFSFFDVCHAFTKMRWFRYHNNSLSSWDKSAAKSIECFIYFEC